MDVPVFRGSNLFLGLTSVVGLIGGAYLLQCGAQHLLGKIVDKKPKREETLEEHNCNVCCAELDTSSTKNYVTCCTCGKYVCRSIKCADWLPKNAQWECELCHSSKESMAQTSSWVAEQMSFNQHKFVYPMRARSEIYIPIGDRNDNTMHFESVSQIGAISTAIMGADERSKIREYVEEIVSEMLGGSLEHIKVGQLSKSENYLPAIVHGQHANNNYNNNNNNAPNASSDLGDISQTRLRSLIEAIIAETLRSSNVYNGSAAVSEISLDTRSNGELLNGNGNGLKRRHRTEHYFEPKIYQELLATAVLNKIADKEGNTRLISESTPDLSGHNIDENYNAEALSTTSGSSIEPRSDCSLTDNELVLNRDKADSHISLEAALERESVLSDYIAAHMVPLPDFSASVTESEDDIGSISSSMIGDGTWEDNWLFKKKRSTMQSSGTPSSIGMLVPAPKECVRAQIGDKTTDEVSDLSEIGSDADESSADLLRCNALNDRLLSKHLIGGQNTKLVLDEIVERSSLISNTLPAEHEPAITETTNTLLVNTDANVLRVPTPTCDNSSAPPPMYFQDDTKNKNEPVTDPNDIDELNELEEGCTGFGTIEWIDDDKILDSSPSVIEILAAMALGPMLAVPASEQPGVMSTSELHTLKELSDLALAEINARTMDLTHHSLDVIEEENSDFKTMRPFEITEIPQVEESIDVAEFPIVTNADNIPEPQLLDNIQSIESIPMPEAITLEILAETDDDMPPMEATNEDLIAVMEPPVPLEIVPSMSTQNETEMHLQTNEIANEAQLAVLEPPLPLDIIPVPEPEIVSPTSTINNSELEAQPEIIPAPVIAETKDVESSGTLATVPENNPEKPIITEVNVVEQASAQDAIVVVEYIPEPKILSTDLPTAEAINTIEATVMPTSSAVASAECQIDAIEPPADEIVASVETATLPESQTNISQCNPVPTEEILPAPVIITPTVPEPQTTATVATSLEFETIPTPEIIPENLTAPAPEIVAAVDHTETPPPVALTETIPEPKIIAPLEPVSVASTEDSGPSPTSEIESTALIDQEIVPASLPAPALEIVAAADTQGPEASQPAECIDAPSTDTIPKPQTITAPGPVTESEIESPDDPQTLVAAAQSEFGSTSLIEAIPESEIITPPAETLPAVSLMENQIVAPTENVALAVPETSGIALPSNCEAVSLTEAILDAEIIAAPTAPTEAPQSGYENVVPREAIPKSEAIAEPQIVVPAETLIDPQALAAPIEDSPVVALDTVELTETNAIAVPETAQQAECGCAALAENPSEIETCSASEIVVPPDPQTTVPAAPSEFKNVPHIETIPEPKLIVNNPQPTENETIPKAEIITTVVTTERPLKAEIATLEPSVPDAEVVAPTEVGLAEESPNVSCTELIPEPNIPATSITNSDVAEATTAVSDTDFVPSEAPAQIVASTEPNISPEVACVAPVDNEATKEISPRPEITATEPTAEIINIVTPIPAAPGPELTSVQSVEVIPEPVDVIPAGNAEEVTPGPSDCSSGIITTEPIQKSNTAATESEPVDPTEIMANPTSLVVTASIVQSAETNQEPEIIATLGSKPEPQISATEPEVATIVESVPEPLSRATLSPIEDTKTDAVQQQAIDKQTIAEVEILTHQQPTAVTPALTDIVESEKLAVQSEALSEEVEAIISQPETTKAEVESDRLAGVPQNNLTEPVATDASPKTETEIEKSGLEADVPKASIAETAPATSPQEADAKEAIPPVVEDLTLCTSDAPAQQSEIVAKAENISDTGIITTASVGAEIEAVDQIPGVEPGAINATACNEKSFAMDQLAPKANLVSSIETISEQPDSSVAEVLIEATTENTPSEDQLVPKSELVTSTDLISEQTDSNVVHVRIDSTSEALNTENTPVAEPPVLENQAITTPPIVEEQIATISKPNVDPPAQEEEIEAQPNESSLAENDLPLAQIESKPITESDEAHAVAPPKQINQSASETESVINTESIPEQISKSTDLKEDEVENTEPISVTESANEPQVPKCETISESESVAETVVNTKQILEPEIKPTEVEAVIKDVPQTTSQELTESLTTAEMAPIISSPAEVNVIAPIESISEPDVVVATESIPVVETPATEQPALEADIEISVAEPTLATMDSTVAAVEIVTTTESLLQEVPAVQDTEIVTSIENIPEPQNILPEAQLAESQILTKTDNLGSTAPEIEAVPQETTLAVVSTEPNLQPTEEVAELEIMPEETNVVAPIESIPKPENVATDPTALQTKTTISTVDIAERNVESTDSKLNDVAIMTTNEPLPQEIAPVAGATVVESIIEGNSESVDVKQIVATEPPAQIAEISGPQTISSESSLAKTEIIIQTEADGVSTEADTVAAKESIIPPENVTNQTTSQTQGDIGTIEIFESEIISTKSPIEVPTECMAPIDTILVVEKQNVADEPQAQTAEISICSENIPEPEINLMESLSAETEVVAQTEAESVATISSPAKADTESIITSENVVMGQTAPQSQSEPVAESKIIATEVSFPETKAVKVTPMVVLPSIELENVEPLAISEPAETTTDSPIELAVSPDNNVTPSEPINAETVKPKDVVEVLSSTEPAQELQPPLTEPHAPEIEEDKETTQIVEEVSPSKQLFEPENNPIDSPNTLLEQTSSLAPTLTVPETETVSVIPAADALAAFVCPPNAEGDDVSNETITNSEIESKIAINDKADPIATTEQVSESPESGETIVALVTDTIANTEAGEVLEVVSTDTSKAEAFIGTPTESILQQKTTVTEPTATEPEITAADSLTINEEILLSTDSVSQIESVAKDPVPAICTEVITDPSAETEVVPQSVNLVTIPQLDQLPMATPEPKADDVPLTESISKPEISVPAKTINEHGTLAELSPKDKPEDSTSSEAMPLEPNAEAIEPTETSKKAAEQQVSVENAAVSETGEVTEKVASDKPISEPHISATESLAAATEVVLCEVEATLTDAEFERTTETIIEEKDPSESIVFDSPVTDPMPTTETVSELSAVTTSEPKIVTTENQKVPPEVIKTIPASSIALARIEESKESTSAPEILKEMQPITETEIVASTEELSPAEAVPGMPIEEITSGVDNSKLQKAATQSTALTIDETLPDSQVDANMPSTAEAIIQDLLESTSGSEILKSEPILESSIALASIEEPTEPIPEPETIKEMLAITETEVVVSTKELSPAEAVVVASTEESPAAEAIPVMPSEQITAGAGDSVLQTAATESAAQTIEEATSDSQVDANVEATAEATIQDFPDIQKSDFEASAEMIPTNEAEEVVSSEQQTSEEPIFSSQIATTEPEPITEPEILIAVVAHAEMVPSAEIEAVLSEQIAPNVTLPDHQIPTIPDSTIEELSEHIPEPEIITAEVVAPSEKVQPAETEIVVPSELMTSDIAIPDPPEGPTTQETIIDSAIDTTGLPLPEATNVEPIPEPDILEAEIVASAEEVPPDESEVVVVPTEMVPPTEIEAVVPSEQIITNVPLHDPQIAIAQLPTPEKTIEELCEHIPEPEILITEGVASTEEGKPAETEVVVPSEPMTSDVAIPELPEAATTQETIIDSEIDTTGLPIPEATNVEAEIVPSAEEVLPAETEALVASEQLASDVPIPDPQNAPTESTAPTKEETKINSEIDATVLPIPEATIVELSEPISEPEIPNTEVVASAEEVPPSDIEAVVSSEQMTGEVQLAASESTAATTVVDETTPDSKIIATEQPTPHLEETKVIALAEIESPIVIPSDDSSVEAISMSQTVAASVETNLEPEIEAVASPEPLPQQSVTQPETTTPETHFTEKERKDFTEISVQELPSTELEATSGEINTPAKVVEATPKINTTESVVTIAEGEVVSQPLTPPIPDADSNTETATITEGETVKISETNLETISESQLAPTKEKQGFETIPSTEPEMLEVEPTETESKEATDNDGCVLGSIAEREVKKWYNAVEMPNNPYAPEALKQRISGNQERCMDLPNISPSSEQKTLALMTATSGNTEDDSRETDYKRYSRDYYINDTNSSTATPTSGKAPTISDTSSDQQNAPTDDDIVINEAQNASKSATKAQTSSESETMLRALPAHILEEGQASLETLSSQPPHSIQTSASDDSETVRVYDFNKQETTIIRAATETAAKSSGTSSSVESSTTTETSKKRERPVVLQFGPADSVPSIGSPRGSTPPAFRFLQPKRRLIEPSQVLSIDEDDVPEPSPSAEKPVIEQDIAHAMPSVKALAQAFLLTSKRTQTERRWRAKVKLMVPPDAADKPATTMARRAMLTHAVSIAEVADESTITSDLSSLETDPSMQSEGQENPTPIASTASPVPVRRGFLRSNIAFFENLKFK